MDSLGKIADIFILIIILFIFPVRWAILQSENLSETGLTEAAEFFLDRIDIDDHISADHIVALNRKMFSYGNYFSDIEVLRSNGERLKADYISENNLFLFPSDIVCLKIYDRGGLAFSFIRMVT